MTIPTNSEALRNFAQEILSREDEDGRTNLEKMLVSMTDAKDFQSKMALIELAYGKAPLRHQVEAIGEVKLIVEHTADWMLADGSEDAPALTESPLLEVSLEDELLGGPHDDPKH